MKTHILNYSPEQVRQYLRLEGYPLTLATQELDPAYTPKTACRACGVDGCGCGDAVTSTPLQEERICMACSVAGCDCDSDCLNCGSRDPNHRCD